MSDHNSEESNISKYKNLDEELESAIEQANNIFRNLAESILNVYNVARGKGYEPFEARAIVENRIINVTPQYIRRILPEEAKHIEKRKISSPMRNKVSHIPPKKEEIIDIEPEPTEEPEPVPQEPEQEPEQPQSQPNLLKDLKFVVKWEIQNTPSYVKTANIDVTVDIDTTHEKVINVRNGVPVYLHETK